MMSLNMSHMTDSNRRPTHYECVALPTELKWPQFKTYGVQRYTFFLFKQIISVEVGMYL